MPKGILRFKLPEEQYEFKYASNAMGLVSTISGIQRFIRDQLKYGAPTPQETKMLESIKKLLQEELDANGFNYWLNE